MAYSRPEPLRGEHRLEGFDCGDEPLNTWLVRYARHAEAAESARVFVTRADEEHVVGYYALVVGEVQAADATARMLKGLPAERPVPVVVLARLAVDHRHQSGGIGRSLLQDAMLRCVRVAEEAGVRALVVHAANDEARDFYRRFGFEESPTDPLHLILLTKDLRRFLDEAEQTTGG